MNTFLALFRRQWAAYFFSPMAYVCLTVFLVVSGLSFVGVVLRSFQDNLVAGDLLFGSQFFWMMALVAMALITMQLFAEERRSGTLETLLTAPVTETQIVMAKFASALLFFMLMVAPTTLYLPVVLAMRSGIGSVEALPLLTGYLGLFLVGAFNIALGVWISSLTRNQVVAAIVSFALMYVIFYAEYITYFVRNPALGAVLNSLSSIRHIMDFSRGILDTRPVVLYLSGVCVCLFAAVKGLESRRGG